MFTKFNLHYVKSNESIRMEDLLAIRTSYPVTDTNLSIISNRYLNELKETDNRIFIIGFDHLNSPFGYVQLIINNADNDPDLANGKNRSHIHDLRVKCDLQNKGFGKSLIKYLETEAKLKGIKTLTLGVDNWNDKAIQFYKKLGYSSFKQVPGRTSDEFVIYMEKEI